LTFSGSIALPGVTLPPGTYVFELADPNVSVDIVRVMSRDRKRVYLTQFTERVSRPAGAPATQLISLGESPRGVPAPVLAWYPTADPMGHRFIYRR
jgi:hypothetical protein